MMIMDDGADVDYYKAGFWVMAKSDSAHRHGVMMNDDAVGDDDDCDDGDYGAGGDG